MGHSDKRKITLKARGLHISINSGACGRDWDSYVQELALQRLESTD